MTSVRPVRTVAALLTAALAGVHVYWAAGCEAGLQAALPQHEDGEVMFRPPVGATLVVAAGLAGMSLAAAQAEQRRWHWPLRLTALVFAVRAVGDGRTVGLTRPPSQTAFARNDARLYTPLCLGLALLFGVLGWAGSKGRGRTAR